MLEVAPQFGEEAVDTQTGRTVWWDGHGWSYARPEDPETQSVPLLTPQPRPPQVPLSYAQQRLWFIDKLEGTSTEYNLLEALSLRGPLDIQALQCALVAMVDRHEILRVHFGEHEGEPVQIIEPALQITLPIEDLSRLEEATRRELVAGAMRQEREQAFDLSRGPLLRMKVLKLGSQEHLLLRTFHHIISDGWSQGIFNREFMALYEAFHEGRENPLAPLQIQYADFALWQRRWLDEATMAGLLAYWKQQLAGIPAELSLPRDRARPAMQTFRAELHRVTLPADTLASLKKLSHNHQATLYMTLLAAFAVLLQRYSGQDDIVVGSPIANRQDAALENLIGFFVNSLVLRVQVKAGESFSELLQMVRKTTLEAYAHQDLPFEKLVEGLSQQRSLNVSPIFQVMFALQNAPMETQQLTGLKVELLKVPGMRAHFDLELHARESEGRLELTWFHNRDLFDCWRIKEMAGNYMRLLRAVVATPERSISALEILDETEKQQLLIEFNRTESAYPQNKPVHRLIEEQVAATPNSVAMILGQQRWTYKELNERANQLAHYLRKSGIGPESRVAILMERSSDVVIALLAVWKAGGAYLPLDPTYPAERLSFMLQDAQVAVLLTHRNLQEAVPAYSGSLIKLDEEWKAIEDERKDNLCSSSASANLAYVIYTSGSTGKPKGAMVTHQALVNFLISVSKEPGINAADVLLAVTTSSFDIAALEIYLPLIAGARVVLATREEVVDGVLLAQKLVEHGITMMQATPATWKLLFASGWEGSKTLKVLCGGEALAPDLAGQLREKCGALWNMYGPTETTVWSVIHPVTESTRTVPLGRPLANTQLYVLDEEMSPVPRGATGELYIGGHGVARGYLNRPALTAERFLPHPWSGNHGSRLYRTGDLVRYLADGRLEFLGRNDHQVKIRGFRIELGEIEAALKAEPGIREALVTVRETEAFGKQLIGYVVTASASIEPDDLRSRLRLTLPEYIVPAAIVVLSSWPLTSNGKIDRKALPDPSAEPVAAAFVAPESEMERSIASIWQRVLRLEKVSIYSNFFDLGGHSLLTIQIHAALKTVTNRTIAVIDLFKYPTIASLAKYLAGNDDNRDDTIKKNMELEKLMRGRSRMKSRLRESFNSHQGMQEGV